MPIRKLVLLLGVSATPVVQAADFNDFEDLFTEEACATAVSALAEDMPSEPLYQMASGSCASSAASDVDTDLAIYSDQSCTTQINFEGLDNAAFCAEVTDKSVFGNDPSAASANPVWRLPPWPTLDAGVLSISDNARPFQARRIYRTVGACQLEMHVFKKAIGETDTKPIMLIHGGSWKYRQTGAIGLFTQVSHYTEAGFTVFSPFYRLTGTGEAAAACSSVSGEEIVADIDAAYEWILAHAAEYGADASALYLGGQSAGAHLAARMSVDRPDTTAGAMLLYPPTDFSAFITAFQAGEIEGAEGTDALEAFLGTSLTETDTSSAVVVNNSLPTRVATSPDTYPPMYLIHGASDTLVPVEQSTRLCNAYNGDPASGASASTAESAAQRQSAECGTEGHLDVVKGGGHVLDFCVQLNAPWNALIDTSNLCPAGSEASRAAAEASVADGIAWLEARAGTQGDEAETDTGSDATADTDNNETATTEATDSGGGAGAALGLTLSGLVALYRRRRQVR